MKELSCLLGLWRGKGIAIFPTIEPTEYVEELLFESIGSEPKIFYRQKTWYLKDNKPSNPLHWESGYINIYGGSKYELSNSQDNGRVEVLTGQIEKSSPDFHLSFTSKLFANDLRMVKSCRDFYVNGNDLKYAMNMETMKTTGFQLHLEAVLKRV